MSKIKITYDNYRTSNPSKEQWGEWSASNDISNISIELVEKKNEMSDFITDFDVLPNTQYFLVWVEYSTGDSFGHEEGVHEFMELFDKYEKAEHFAKALRTHYEWTQYKKSYNYRKLTKKEQILKDSEMTSLMEGYFSYSEKKDQELDVDTYQVVYNDKKYYIPWVGYFESLSNIHVEPVSINLKRKSF